MSNTNNDHDLFTASLESIETSKRVDKYQRFKNDFQRECIATLDNAQEWIKAELPIVTDYVDASAIKDELKQSKTSGRRKHLLSALLFEKSLREAVENNNADTAAMMAVHMFNNMWQAKVELTGVAPVAASNASSISNVAKDSALETYNDTREKILTTLIEKGEKLKQDSQIQSNIKPATKQVKKPDPVNHPTTKSQEKSKSSFTAQKNEDFRLQEDAKLPNRPSNIKTKKAKKKSNSMFAKVKTKIPLKRKKSKIVSQPSTVNDIAQNSPDDSLLDDPNRSAIHVSPGFSDSIDDSLIKARSDIFKDPNESGVTVHKVLKTRDHEKQDPGSNTIIMKLASSAGKKRTGKLSIPEQCQDAINMLTQQFPGYDMVAIRHMAAEKIGVSPQYIENLNILPDKTV